jgi:hypothetical protein
MKRLSLYLPLALAGCVTAQATMLGPNLNYAPVPEAEVRVFLREDLVPGNCTQYALIHTTGSADWTNETDLIAAARRRAGKIGANAVLLGEVRDPKAGTRFVAAIFNVPANQKGQLLAYRCEDTAGVPTGTADTTPRPGLPVVYMD